MRHYESLRQRIVCQEYIPVIKCCIQAKKFKV